MSHKRKFFPFLIRINPKMCESSEAWRNHYVSKLQAPLPSCGVEQSTVNVSRAGKNSSGFSCRFRAIAGEARDVTTILFQLQMLFLCVFLGILKKILWPLPKVSGPASTTSQLFTNRKTSGIEEKSIATKYMRPDLKFENILL